MISIVLPFRNAAETIQACLSSIRAQSLADFEILAIDDHSSDNSRSLVAQFPDHRIRLLDNPGRGLVSALNFGIDRARQPLIARMDADDLMRPARLQSQCSMMQQSPGLSLVGSRVALFPSRLVASGYREYVRWQNGLTTPEAIANQRFVESPLAHPSVLFRKSVVIAEGGYRQGDFPEDYELWLRLLERGHRLGKHPDILLDWRESAGRLSRTSSAYARPAFDRLRSEFLYRYLRDRVLPDNRGIVIWGAGRRTRLRCGHLLNQGIVPQRWIDIDPRKIGNSLDGVRVEPPQWLMREDHNRPFVLNYVTNHGARDLIEAELGSYGFKQSTDYLSVG